MTTRPGVILKALSVGLAAASVAQRSVAQCPAAAEREVLDHRRTRDVVAMDKSVLAVGLPDADDLGESSGAVVVYRNNGRNWVQEARLTASDGTRNQQFGEVVVVNRDRIVVGVPRADFDGLYDAGAAYVFHYEDGAWKEEARLTSTRPTARVYFGSTAAIKDDLLVVGVGYHQSVNIWEAVVFRHDGRQWVFEQTLDEHNYPRRHFGSTVAVSGNWIAVAATYDARSQLIYTFERDEGVWVRTNVLHVPYAAEFATSGKRLLTGGTYAPSVNPDRAFLLKKQGNGWLWEADLVHYDGRNLQDFGDAMSLGKNHAIIGASAGYLYVYARGDEGWAQSERIHRGSAGFGRSVGLSGSTLAVGDSTYTGAPAYLFELCPLPVACEQITAVKAKCDVRGESFRVETRLKSKLPRGTRVTLLIDGERSQVIPVTKRGKATARWGVSSSGVHEVTVQECPDWRVSAQCGR